MILMFKEVLNYGHTGAAYVLIHTLIDHIWLSLGLIFDGLLSLFSRFVSYGDLTKKSIKLYMKH